jgi:hypothetical protein
VRRIPAPLEPPLCCRRPAKGGPSSPRLDAAQRTQTHHLKKKEQRKLLSQFFQLITPRHHSITASTPGAPMPPPCRNGANPSRPIAPLPPGMKINQLIATQQYHLKTKSAPGLPGNRRQFTEPRRVRSSGGGKDASRHPPFFTHFIAFFTRGTLHPPRAKAFNFCQIKHREGNLD